ncbi:related to nitrate reductase [NADPH] [Phialocephala subalpina]|uniref:Nitrate reductase [NADPH] n=1 Tax=Phialocephala subalpina TaxID=576137 RepID=A0A1L7WQ13_9HELO|nr:related to nitrate reductase [NADPH] [Phialocephala subalpina]
MFVSKSVVKVARPTDLISATKSPAFRRAFFRSARPRSNGGSRIASKISPKSNSQSKYPPRRTAIVAGFAGGGFFSIFLGARLHKSKEQDVVVEKNDEVVEDGGMRKIRLSDVKSHDGSSSRPWVTRGNSVYDITDWIGVHPGGEVILRAAGGSIDVYWDIFSIHKKQDVYDILEQYKIGEIDEQDLVDGKLPKEAIDDPFLTDPKRCPELRTLTAKPCNAETPGKGLAEFLTPNKMFYVRNHMWVPVVEEGKHELTVELPDGEEKSYTLKELKERFPTHKVTATLQCAGNRRKDMTDNQSKVTNGLQWTAGAISTAEWEGVKLKDVLADAGLKPDSLPEDAKHAQFTGLEAYGASIPMSKAVDPHGDVLLAFRMNGEELPRDHGYPLRVIVPGNVAARSVKWLRKIVISDEESLSQWQRRDYKCFGPNVSVPDWSKAKSIQEMPITSAITGISNPSLPKDSKDGKPISVEGYAYSGGGREIVRVDISTDGGKTWDQAELVDDQMNGAKAWCWKRWRYSGLKRDSGKTSVLVKATDEAYNTQPESYDAIYNPRGNLATAWHRVEIDSKA